ncbi:MAG: OmpA family protein [Bacteroidia bacterium]|nr:OmpA family protein [Bacteroidia bacterium]
MKHPFKKILQVIFIITFIFLYIPYATSSEKPAEQSKSMKPWRLKRFGKNAERVGDIYTAIDYYETYCRKKPKNFKITYKLAELYRRSRDYVNAETYYQKVYEGAPKDFPLALYYYSTMQKMNGKYKEAVQNYMKFGKEYRGQKDEKFYKNLSKAEVTGCELAQSYIDTVWNKAKNKVIVTHLDTSINKANIEFSPIPVNETSFIYAALKKDSVPFYNTDDTAKRPVRKFYVARKIKNEWRGGIAYPGPFNDDEMDVGNGAFSPDGKKFYFTYCVRNWKNKPVCAIYVSKKDSDEFWMPPEMLPKPINLRKYSSTMPALGTDSRTGQEVLYFTSDRPEGLGGMDLWFSVFNKKTKTWSEVKNMGKLVNTPGEELTPYYDIPTRTLYYSSDKLPGFGGLDVYKTIGEQKNWTRPENLGYPINSSADDIYFVLSKTKGEGFFASNRAGGVTLRNVTCCDDLYTFQAPDLIKIVAKGTLFAVKDSSLFKLLTKSANSEFVNIDKNKIDTNTVTLLGNKLVSLFMIKENTRDSVFISNTGTDSKGEYSFNLEQGNSYIVRIENYGYDNKRMNVSTWNITKSDTIKLDAVYMKVMADNTGKIIKEKEAIVLKNITYEFAKSDLTPDALDYLDKFVLTTMTKMPKIVVEISAHTDSVSSDAYNLKLSQKRADNVVKYLISKGITIDRLISKGYGKSQPIARNTNPDGTDNPTGREKNRRTEFKIVGSTDQYYEIDR